jgi:hypothetical protein
MNKPIEEWTEEDYFVAIGCIYCLNNGGYNGPPILSKHDYECHVVAKHAGRTGYPRRPDLEKYGLKVPGENENGNGNGKSKAAEAAEVNLSGNEIMPE